jgi:hypothetical protein
MSLPPTSRKLRLTAMALTRQQRALFGPRLEAAGGKTPERRVSLQSDSKFSRHLLLGV